MSLGLCLAVVPSTARIVFGLDQCGSCKPGFEVEVEEVDVEEVEVEEGSEGQRKTRRESSITIKNLSIRWRTRLKLGRDEFRSNH